MTIKTLALIALLAGVAACGQKPDTAPAPAASSGPVAPGTMVKGKGKPTRRLSVMGLQMSVMLYRDTICLTLIFLAQFII